MAKNTHVSIIILNWNSWRDTVECLESLYQITYPNYSVVVVDNDSKDDSVQKIKEYATGKIKVESKFFEYSLENKPVKVVEHTRKEAEAIRGKESKIENLPSNRKMVLIKNERNYGFSEGNNVGIRYATRALNPEYILLLNNDTVVDKGFLSKLVKVAESDEKIGIVGSRILYYYDPYVAQSSGGKIHLLLGVIRNYRTGDYKEVKDLDFVYGTSFFLKKKVIEKVSLLDPYFFFGIEEYDYCIRVKKAGFRIVYNPHSKVWHKKGASKAKIAQYPETLAIVAQRSGLLQWRYYYRLFQKHLPSHFFIIPVLIAIMHGAAYNQVYSKAKSSVRFLKCLLKGDSWRIKGDRSLHT